MCVCEKALAEAEALKKSKGEDSAEYKAKHKEALGHLAAAQAKKGHTQWPH